MVADWRKPRRNAAQTRKAGHSRARPSPLTAVSAEFAPGTTDSPSATLLELEFGRKVSETNPFRRAGRSNHLVFSGNLIDRGRTAARRSDSYGLQSGYRVQPSSNSQTRAGC
jgi:hypothetical protein